MKCQTYAILLLLLQPAHRALAEGTYIQALSNSHIREVAIDYCVYDGIAADATDQDRMLHKARHAWSLDKQRLIQRISRVSIQEAAESDPKSRPSQHVYDHGPIRFADSTNDLTGIESQMNLIMTGHWMPPRSADRSSSLRLACPLLGCFVAGNPYMERYEGEYTIRALGEVRFKGVRCMKYSCSIEGPFLTYFKRKGVTTESEKDAMLKLQQSFAVSGAMFVDSTTGIICARMEEIQFKVSESQRADLASEWVTTRKHARLARKRSWIMESVTTAYR